MIASTPPHFYMLYGFALQPKTSKLYRLGLVFFSKERHK